MIAGAIGVVVLRNPFYSVLALVVHLLSLAVLFLLLRAEFVAAVQVVVYAGAVMVLYVFVVAYVGGQGEPHRRAPARAGPVGSGCASAARSSRGALFVELLIALLGTGLKAIDGDGAGYSPGPRRSARPAYIGKLLLTRFLLAFEIASFLLLIAAVGGVVLARRRRGLRGRRRTSRRGALRARSAPADAPRASARRAAARTAERRSGRRDEHRLVPRGLGDRLLARRGRRDHAPQPAGGAAVPGADAQRRATSR